MKKMISTVMTPDQIIIVFIPKKVMANRGMIRFHAIPEEVIPPVMKVRMVKCQHRAAMVMFPDAVIWPDFKTRMETMQTVIITPNMLAARKELPMLYHLMMLGTKKRKPKWEKMASCLALR
jgi:hypothetical protein